MGKIQPQKMSTSFNDSREYVRVKNWKGWSGLIPPIGTVWRATRACEMRDQREGDMNGKFGWWKAMVRGFGVVALLLMLMTAWSDRAFSITLLHEFAGGGDDGRIPGLSWILSGGTLYGMTDCDGDSNKGTVLSLPIPEPSAALLIMLGAGGVTARRRKVRAKRFAAR